MAKLAQAQIEQLSAVGAYLRQVRQEQGLSLDLVANQVFIRPALLKALEEGREDELPEPVFVQGFIRRYAEALGLDGQVLSQEFSVTPVDVLPDPGAAENGSSKGVVEPETRRSIKVLAKADTSRSAAGNRQIMLWAALGAVGLGLIIGLWNLFSSPRPVAVAPDPTVPAEDSGETAAAPEATTSSSTSEPPPAAEAEAEPEPEPLAVEESQPEAPVVVTVTVTDPSWLDVTVDGQKVLSETAKAGFVQTWTADRSIRVNAGNASGVEVAANGQDAVVLGNQGEVKTVTFTPEAEAQALPGQ